MDIISKIRDKARRLKLKLVLPEGKDPRVIEAARIIVKEGLVSALILLGNPIEVEIPGVEVIDYLNSPDMLRYVEEYYEMRKAKGITIEEARETLKNPTFYGMFMVKEGKVDTLVSGSLETTANVLKATMHIIGLAEGNRTLSSCFLMIVPDCSYGEDGVFLFADCGAVPDPTPEQLADIAITTADTAKVLLGTEPRVAMLSFSTKGSAKHRTIDKVIKATEIVKDKKPELYIDGELQADSAIVPDVARRKLKDSPVAGRANVLIFPDLNSGNICYKLVERLAKARALGPLVQGTRKIVSDLSRGCSVEDIVDVSAVTLLRVGMYSR